MIRQVRIRAPFILMAPLLAGLQACTAFDLGPQTQAAVAANAASPGFPRIVDVPQAPADLPTLDSHEARAAALVADREALEAAADAIRAARPEAPEADITPPEPIPGGPARPGA